MRMPSRATTQWVMSDVATDILTTCFILTARGSIVYAANMATTVRLSRRNHDANTLTSDYEQIEIQAGAHADAQR